jgi:hypothetical protein
MARFTAANAREMAARSVAARKTAATERTAWAALTPVPATTSTGEDPGISPSCVLARLQTLDCLMAKAKTDREWDNLSRAFERLFKVWCVLTNTPGPGNRRPKALSKPAFVDDWPQPIGIAKTATNGDGSEAGSAA